MRLTQFLDANTPANTDRMLTSQLATPSVTSTSISINATSAIISGVGTNDGFAVGHLIYVSGFVNAGNNGSTEIVAATPTTIEVSGPQILVTEAAGPSVTIQKWITREYTYQQLHRHQRAFSISAKELNPRSSEGATAFTVLGGASGKPDIPSMAFPAFLNRYAEYWRVMPSSYDGGPLYAKFVWTHGATAGPYVVHWRVEAVAIANDEPKNPNFGSPVTIVTAGGTAEDVYVTPMSTAITPGGTPAGNELMCFRFSRYAADNLPIDARLAAVVIYYTSGGLDT